MNKPYAIPVNTHATDVNIITVIIAYYNATIAYNSIATHADTKHTIVETAYRKIKK